VRQPVPKPTERQHHPGSVQYSGWVKVAIDEMVAPPPQTLRIQEGSKALDTDTSRYVIVIEKDGRVERKARYQNGNILNFQAVKQTLQI